MLTQNWDLELSPTPAFLPYDQEGTEVGEEMATSESGLEGAGEKMGNTPVRLATGHKDTSMRLTIRRQTSKLKPFDLKVLTVRKGRGRKKRWMSTAARRRGGNGTRWGGRSHEGVVDHSHLLDILLRSFCRSYTFTWLS